MQRQKPDESGAAAELAGDPQLLLGQLGSSEALSALALLVASLQTIHLASEPALRQFLHHYLTQILIPIEWPAIHQAFQEARRGAVRELIACDQQLAREPKLAAFITASQNAGNRQLKRLRTFRDQRLVRRYLQAVEDGHAYGWHTIVYGVILTLYSIPLRQGLLSYACTTLNGFIQAAASPLQLSERDRQRLLDALCRELPRELEKLLAAKT